MNFQRSGCSFPIRALPCVSVLQPCTGWLSRLCWWCRVGASGRSFQAIKLGGSVQTVVARPELRFDYIENVQVQPPPTPYLPLPTSSHSAVGPLLALAPSATSSPPSPSGWMEQPLTTVRRLQYYVDVLVSVLERNNSMVRKCACQFLLGLAARPEWRPKLAGAVGTVLALLGNPEGSFLQDCASSLRLLAVAPEVRSDRREPSAAFAAQAAAALWTSF